MSTTVKNPSTRNGLLGFVKCIHCGQTFTRLGLPRHWNHCDERFKGIAQMARDVYRSGANRKKRPVTPPIQLWIVGRYKPLNQVEYLATTTPVTWCATQNDAICCCVFTDRPHAKAFAKLHSGFVKQIA